MDLIQRQRSFPDPFDEFDRLQREINELFDFSAVSGSRGLYDRSVSPALDVLENDGGFTVRVDLPGLNEDDIELSVASGVLTLKGNKKAPQRSGDTRVYRQETWEGSFQRTVSLPSSADPGQVEAELKNGVLEVRIGKKAEAQPKRITLKVS
jgi:HSP20 family protein